MAEWVGQVRRIGEFLMVAIPGEIAAEEGIHEGSSVRIRIVKKRQSPFGAFPGLAPWGHKNESQND